MFVRPPRGDNIKWACLGVRVRILGKKKIMVFIFVLKRKNPEFWVGSKSEQDC